MASNQIRRSGAHPSSKADSKKSGFTIDPGPYEAIVQGYVAGNRMGQLIVSIPEWSGTIGPGPFTEQGSASDQIVVSYASPFYGSTYGADTADIPDTPQTAGQSYGFWFVPPDIGNKVLVTFVAGDMHRGYWFACIYDSPSHHMVPANGRNIGGPEKVTPPPAADKLEGLNSTSNLPVVEYSISDPGAFTSDGLLNTPRFPHEMQTKILIHQGLDQDKVRGAISSSSLRECPSNVYGISTPGASPTKTPQVSGNPQAVFFRKGGHTFVMDDGADASSKEPAGTDQLIRLRTSGGHQILMNDTEHVLYIASASGDQWLEFSNHGAVNIYAKHGFNLRSTGAINMHSESAINMCAPTIDIASLPSATYIGIPSVNISSTGSLSLSSVTSTKVKANTGLTLSSIATLDILAVGELTVAATARTVIQSKGLLQMSGAVVELDGNMLYLNCCPENITDLPKPPKPAMPPKPHALQDTAFNGTNYINAGSQLFSTCTVAPAHEPWVDKHILPGEKGAGVTRPTLSIAETLL